MKLNSLFLSAVLAASVSAGLPAVAAVSEQEAQQLKSTLTPLGGERAGNKDGTIPAWNGGEVKLPSGFTSAQRRPDPFAAEKPLYSISAKTMAQYADALTDGQKAMLQRYPNYRMDVYPTHRTAVAPQWVYDNTLRNATRAKLVDGANYPIPSGAYGGPPFPIPKSGLEVMWNHLLRYQGTQTRTINGQTWMVTADGKKVMVVKGEQDILMPYYDPNGSAEKFDGVFWLTRVMNDGPPIRAGEALVGRLHVDDAKTNTWVYLTGQRRVRKLPNPNGDTPLPTSAGLLSFDEVSVFAGGPGLFDWTLVGKKEMLIPYNAYKMLQPDNPEALMTGAFLNPDHVRWERHRVWVVEASLKSGKRHTSPRSRYYVDEDSWLAVLADRWDANGQLWKTLYGMPVTYAEMSMTEIVTFGFYDLLSGAWYAGPFMNAPASAIGVTPSTDLKDSDFTPDAMVGNQLR
ncbi:hypothetical protein AZL_a10910 (plasmid) [Azospirillum sp. B510]|uniref:DUF1329 domain-containing protein n=1 Tax=Azospirillum sp. (strain B510) TaxID=137722 RepID=UPI0001C4B867|nr:DUF1329 domain-containing protein [Azospirillum sp. B510]BAI74622.1 hypothetical protein AZL_a10910 [Azospirillum sp. B510]